MFRVRGLILYLFIQKQKVIFDFIISCINENSGVIEIFLEKNLKLNLEQKSYLTLIIIPVMVETNLLTRKRDNK